MILAAQDIRVRQPLMPMFERTRTHGMTFGLGPAGYDIRIAQDRILLPFFGFRLASAIERFDMPDDVLGVVHDKSTWARRGITVQNTVIEPGWRGYLTLEITNHSWRLVRLRAGMPIAQVIFHRLSSPTVIPYAGKYQDQAAGPQPARIEA